MRPLILGAVLAGLALPVLAEEAAPLEDISRFTLENGLEGVVIEDHRAPVVTSMLWYKVGSADEPPGQSGIAHFLEHLMFKGTETLDEGEFSRIISANGGDENAFTSFDHTAFYQRIAADRLDLVLGMEADRMVNLQLGEAAVASEREVVREERRQRVENDPDALFDEQRRAAFYLNHPYGDPVIGWMHEIEDLTREEALDFYRTYYAPNNAVLVVAGDVTPEEVERLAEKHFGAIPAVADIPPRLRPQEPPHRAARWLQARDPRVAQASLVRLYLAPQRRTGDQAEAAALTVLDGLLGGSGITALMPRELVLGEGVALDAGSFYWPTGLDPQSFGLYLLPKPGVEPEAAEAALDALIARFLEEGPDPEQLERVKTRLRAAEIYALDDQMGRARRVGAALTTGLDLKDVQAWPEAIAAVTAADVMAAARAVFRPEASVTGWLLPPETPEIGQ